MCDSHKSELATKLEAVWQNNKLAYPGHKAAWSLNEDYWDDIVGVYYMQGAKYPNPLVRAGRPRPPSQYRSKTGSGRQGPSRKDQAVRS